MAGGGGGQGRGSALSINLTPMIDCTMLLVIFFLLTTQIASPDMVSMKLPRPTHSISRERSDTNRAVVNVVPYTDVEIANGQGTREKAFDYRIGNDRYSKSELNRMMLRLKELKKLSEKPEEFMVQIRADEQLEFTEVEPIFQMLMQTQIKKVQLAAMRNIGG